MGSCPTKILHLCRSMWGWKKSCTCLLQLGQDPFPGPELGWGADAPPVLLCSVLGSPRQQANLSQQTINFCFPVFPLYFRPDAGAVLLPKLPRCCRLPPSSCRCCAAEAAGMLCAASLSRNVSCKWGRGKFAPLNCCS